MKTYIKFGSKLIILICFCINLAHAQQGKINGISIVAPPSEFIEDPFPRVKETYADWICLIPYGYTRIGSTIVQYNMDRQWWGERKEGIVESIKLAQKNNLKIFLKPQIYVPGSWPGGIQFDTEKEWLEWEKNYKEFILFYIDIATSFDVELFCIGTEFKQSVQQRPKYWQDLIAEIKKSYCGKLTYSANWDSYENPQFWDSIDYIGISAYFPLVDAKNPSVRRIKSAWRPIVNELSRLSKKHQNKPILFTEYGYLTVDGTTYQNWKLEKKINQLKVNQKAQADALEAMYSVFSEQDFWAGGFLWKWFPNNMGHEGYMDKDYTPKDKMAEDILKKWFQ